MKLVTFLLPEAYLNGIDRLVELGRFQSRSEAVRNAIEEIMKEELQYTKARKTMRKMASAIAVAQDT